MQAIRILIIFALFFSCKPQKEVIKTRFVSDTLIRHEVNDIKLPVKNITVIENPCKGDTLKKINQTIKSGSATLVIKEEAGNLVIEQNIDSIVNSKVSEILKHTEKEKEVVTITKLKVPKWSWWVLGVLVFYIAYRILRIQFPFLKILPY
jgi:hypothetical protein